MQNKFGVTFFISYSFSMNYIIIRFLNLTLSYFYKAATMKVTLETLIYIEEFLFPYTCTEEEWLHLVAWYFISSECFLAQMRTKINVDLKIGRVFQLVVYHDKIIIIFQWRRCDIVMGTTASVYDDDYNYNRRRRHSDEVFSYYAAKAVVFGIRVVAALAGGDIDICD